MERTARAYWITNPGAGELRQETLPKPGKTAVLARSLHSAVSRGSETLVFQGRVPESQADIMRAPFQAGQFPGPVKYGYANVAEVEEGPAKLRGRKVFCLYPHQDRYVVPATAVVPLPADVPAGRAVLAANMETALNALWDAAPAPGARLAVVGAGLVGCLFAWLVARHGACQVQLIDLDPAKAPVARALGADFAQPAEAADDAQLVVHASGSAEGLATALSLAAFEATVLELSWFGAGAVPVPLGEDFHSKRLTLRASQVGQVAPSHRDKWNRRRRLSAALALLGAPVLDQLITGHSPFAELPDTMAWLATAPPGVLCHRIDY